MFGIVKFKVGSDVNKLPSLSCVTEFITEDREFYGFI